MRAIGFSARGSLLCTLAFALVVVQGCINDGFEDDVGYEPTPSAELLSFEPTPVVLQLGAPYAGTFQARFRVSGAVVTGVDLNTGNVPAGIAVEIGETDWDHVDGVCSAPLDVRLDGACEPMDDFFEITCSLLSDSAFEPFILRIDLRAFCEAEPIVFSNRPDGGGDREIWAIDPDGENLLQLTDNSFEDDDPAWSPDRSKIAFISYRDNGARSDLFLMNPDGTEQEKVADFAGMGTAARHPAWSPSGDRIAVTADNGFFTNIWVVDLVTNPPMVEQVTFQPASPVLHNYDDNPKWSEDGTQVLFLRSGEMYTVAAGGGTPSLLLAPADPSDAILTFDSGPPGVVLGYYVSSETRARLRWVDDFATAVTEGGTHLSDAWPSWAPSLDAVVFERQDESSQWLFIVSVDDNSPHDAQEIPNQPTGSNEHPDWGFPP